VQPNDSIITEKSTVAKGSVFLRSALKYRELGWEPFPLKEGAKEPLTEHGYLDATRDEKQIVRWWTKWPNANIGVPTGLLFWVLDVDPRHGGDESLRMLIYKHGPLPDTIQQQTGGGGRHYLFLQPDQREIGCHTAILPGLDVKGFGGYIVVPPSIHPSGNPYVWDGADRLENQPILPAPAWLLDLLDARNGNQAEKVRAPERILKGVQHRTLFKLGCAMRANGFGEAEIFAALWEANRTRCENPGPEKNIRKLAHSICERYPSGTSATRARAQEPLWTVEVDPNRITPSLELLNACPIFGGRLEFTSVKRRGPMIVARFAGARVEAVWPSIQDLISFPKSQAILFETTQTLIRTPKRRAAKASWEPVAQAIMRLAGASDITSMDSLRDEFADILHTTWKRAECPEATDDEEFMEQLRACQTHARNPQGPPPSYCVWHDGEHCYVHQPSLIEWLSTPGGRNKHYDWADVRKALLLLGFEREQIHRSRGGETINVRLWKGPLELLVDDET
jgi:hypothetical protein